MTRGKLKAWLIALACGGVPLVTSATCDPYAGVLDIYRDDDGYSYYDDGYYYEEVYYVDYYEEDCFLFFCD